MIATFFYKNYLRTEHPNKVGILKITHNLQHVQNEILKKKKKKQKKKKKEKEPREKKKVIEKMKKKQYLSTFVLMTSNI